MRCPSRSSSSTRIRSTLPLLVVLNITAILVLFLSNNNVSAFSIHSHPLSLRASSSSSLVVMSAMNKKNKFNKQKDLAAKMEEAKRMRELQNAGDTDESSLEAPAAAAVETPSSKSGDSLTAEEIKLRNDRQRFDDMLENSMNRMTEFDVGSYLTVEQEEENANAVYRGITRLYEGDPAPTSPFADLIDMHTDQPLGESGTSRIVPWLRSKSSQDFIVVITDPRPKSVELRDAVKKLCNVGGSGLGADVLAKCVVINSDSPAESRRFVKKSFGGEGSSGMIATGIGTRDGLTILGDDKLEWMREYTALGEKRFSMTMFILSDGKVQKIARDVDADVICIVVKNAMKSMV